MKTRFLFTAILSFLLAAWGTVFAGPGDKGKGSVVIEHATGSDKAEGTVEINVSLPGAIAHLLNHDFDCVPKNVNSLDTESEVTAALGEPVANYYCFLDEPE